MVWQDYVIALVQIGLVIALIPTLRGKDKPALSTSIMNTLLLGIITFCFFTLELYFATCTVLATALAWAVLAVQKMKQEKTEN